MLNPITPAVYERLRRQAWTYLLAGGGIVPSDTPGDLESHIGAVAEAHFDGNAAETEFDKAIASFEYAQREAINSAAWSIVGAHEDAAFVFGVAVGLQLSGTATKDGHK